MIDQVTAALKAKYGANARVDIYANDEGKRVVEFCVEIPRGPRQRPKRAAIVMNCASLPDDCCEKVLKHIEQGLAVYR